MARNASSKNAGTFVTNDWRQLSAPPSNAAENFWISTAASDEMFADEKLTDVGAGGGVGGLRVLSHDLALLKQDSHQIKAVVYDLQQDRDNLRTAIRKLKVENVRMKAKLKRLSDVVKVQCGGDKMDVDQLEEEVDYEDLRQFLLVGGPKDPFAIQFNEASIQDFKDPARTEHKSCERFYWYKLAQTFDDKEAMQKILTAEDSRKAEEVVNEVKNFNQATWDSVKLKFWEECQRMKFDQHRWIRNLLVKTGSTYIAVASHDKILGTGWRKQREEASRTQLWDGDNQGGKILMKLREEYTENHTWTSPQEEQDALTKFNDLRRSIWKPYGAGIRGALNLGLGVMGGNARRMPRGAVGGMGGGVGVFPPPMTSSSSVAARFASKSGAANGKKRRQI